MSARRLVACLFVVVVGVMVFACAPALAAAPETPETGSAGAVTANTATLEGGVLNPNAAGEPGEYEYLYRASETGCEGGSVAPVPEGMALGLEKEAVPPVKLTDLKAAQAYTFCLVERNAANPGEVSLASAPVTFTTLDAQPAIESEYATYVEASGATLNAQIDPDGEATTYYFQYGTSEVYGESTAETALSKNGTATVRIPAAGKPALKPDTTYHYRVVAINALSPTGGTPGSDKTFTTPAALGSEPAQNCPNEQRRAEQPYALELPDCRAYEMVSPLETNGNDATDSFVETGPRASVLGEAITYASEGNFANPTGETGENQFVSRRGPEGWRTQAVTPIHNPTQAETIASYLADEFTPELTEGVANTNASLTSEAPGGEELYLNDFGNGTYRFLGSGINSMGASTDLSHVVLGEFGSASEWVNGKVVPVNVNNNDETLKASIGSESDSYENDKNIWHAVSAAGTRVYFTNPLALYLRENPEQPQSPLASPETYGTGTLTKGSDTVSSLVTASALAGISEGATKVEVGYVNFGRFVVGEPLYGPGIVAGTTIVKIEGSILTMSSPFTGEGNSGGIPVSAGGPEPFLVGEKVTGNGIAKGTTVTAVAPGTLTLSAPAASSGNAVALIAGGECTVPTDACTVDVSASQRLQENPAGTPRPLYWGASADGSKVFFTSDAELTEDAYTGPSGNAANLYEYELSSEPGKSGRLTDLTVDKADVDGAAVQGVVQISEDGSYVYFVADGKLAVGATSGAPNLYVTHGGGAPRFITTLAAGDRSVWRGYGSDGSQDQEESGPEVNNAVVTGNGTYLAFLSEGSLTGYDNEQAESGGCEGQIGGTDGAGERETGRCQEVFLYDAQTSQLACASCNPTGGRPVGPSNLTIFNHYKLAGYRPRNLIEGGTLFFDSSDALVPHASDGRQNVYEYENGHVYPVSDVAGGYESFFMDASANGENVFFGTADQLLPQDTSNNVAVYDARVGGGYPVRVAPPSCDNGDACKPPPAPQPGVFAAPGSATFSGPGNITPSVQVGVAVKAKAKSARCKKGYEKKKGKCVKKPRSKKKVKKSSNRRGSK